MPSSTASHSASTGGGDSEFRMKPPKPSRWRTPEFYFYYVGFLTVVPFMAYSTYQLSSPELPNFKVYEHELSEGWLFGSRPMDNSDTQYRGFRNHLPLLSLGMLAFVALNRGGGAALLRACRRATAGNMPGVASPALSPASGPARLFSSATTCCGWPRVLPRLYLTLILSLAVLYIVFGNSLLIILFLTGINYGLARALGGWPVVGPITIWVFNVGMLFLNETYHGYHFADFAPRLAFLDHNRGIMTRWDIFFNITMLRMVSFAMDYHWSLLAERTSRAATSHTESSQGVNDPASPTADPATVGVADVNPATAITDGVAPVPASWHGHPRPSTDRDRITQPLAPSDYNWVHYLAYLFYVPLYLAGPIITFNNFIWQHRFPSREVTTRGTVTYGLRLLGALFLMECMQHLFYVVAISRAHAWSGYSPFQISMIGYFSLKFIWLKLLIMWRFFRFWALADGLEVLENMRRCMSNNYSAQSFWRDWHCSFNRWLVRYVYVPLGGRRYAAYNVWAVFTFVALWHDISLRLLAWAWLISLMFAPELLLSYVFNRPPYSQHRYFRHLCAVGCVLNICMMMVANLVGFAVGVDGIRTMLTEIFCLRGAVFIVASLICIFIAIQVMFEIREHEYRKLYVRKVEDWRLRYPDRPLPSSAVAGLKVATGRSAGGDIETDESGRYAKDGDNDESTIPLRPLASVH
ncbi:glycerol transporter [Tieghemiomyces parasiticus]|uniref:Glycerol transporter n=1 Tax=Tieghemiomyces parasiticus TaxID=78921 RepID=A0A9W8E352_9FUNG|nr:glycerol transporter [Tieghemiomyces parasiticus]